MGDNLAYTSFLNISKVSSKLYLQKSVSVNEEGEEGWETLI